MTESAVTAKPDVGLDAKRVRTGVLDSIDTEMQKTVASGAGDEATSSTATVVLESTTARPPVPTVIQPTSTREVETESTVTLTPVLKVENDVITVKDTNVSIVETGAAAAAETTILTTTVMPDVESGSQTASHKIEPETAALLPKSHGKNAREKTSCVTVNAAETAGMSTAFEEDEWEEEEWSSEETSEEKNDFDFRSVERKRYNFGMKEGYDKGRSAGLLIGFREGFDAGIKEKMERGNACGMARLVFNYKCCRASYLNADRLFTKPGMQLSAGFFED